MNYMSMSCVGLLVSRGISLFQGWASWSAAKGILSGLNFGWPWKAPGSFFSKKSDISQ